MSISTAPAGGLRLRVPRGLAKAVQGLLAAVIVADLFSIASTAKFHGLWSTMIDQGSDAVSDQEYEQAAYWHEFASLVQGTTLLVCAVAFIVWFYRMRVNTEVVAPYAHSMASEWAVWGWLVPVVSLWFPHRIALDTWAASEPGHHLSATRRTSTALVNIWWLLWVTSVNFGIVASALYTVVEEPGAVEKTLTLLMAVDVVDIAAGVLAIVFVHRLTAMQHRREADLYTAA
ncbi:DUF4328 domain-containing protein [Streptomyces zingiberis]|uniref:DUF4328 domain-containing protein n=1 Tax=Streptomyces zingiberis TaxID=2053010 RepID=A0ABX1C527_9ACTN|nr:DUF4328 domain-containing protein [Streptomyces zingiberis]NJQ02044.1 DUF4328 domain-containing protein [Streptomyces zingiberis]